MRERIASIIVSRMTVSPCVSRICRRHGASLRLPRRHGCATHSRERATRSGIPSSDFSFSSRGAGRGLRAHLFCPRSSSGRRRGEDYNTRGAVWLHQSIRACTAAPDVRPAYLRRQAGQDRGDIAAGLQAEDGAAIVKQVEFDIAATADELFVAVAVGPVLVEIGAHEMAVDDEEGAPDILGEVEVGIPAALVLG